jgi:sugar phosphate isomerase/epimerase
MQLSLSVRIAEAPSKTRLHLPFEEILEVAAANGYGAICMRASAGGVQTSPHQLEQMKQQINAAGLVVSMVTADFDVPLNNDSGPDSLRDIGPSLDVASILGSDLVRICMKQDADIPFARDSADRAAERGIRLVHQCHTSSIFEQVDRMLEVVAEIDRPNFGIVYEPANLMLCDQSYGQDTLERLAPCLMNVYVQNHRLDEGGPESLPTYCRGDVHFHHLPLWETGGVDFAGVFSGLAAIGYDGYFTIHQAEGIETVEDAHRFAAQMARFFHDSLVN